MAKSASKPGKLSTKDVPETGGGSGISKTLQPGNTVVKINSIELRKEPFEGDPYNILLHCEGEPQGDGFEGFAIDKNRPELGHAKGQVGRVRATEYSFSNRVFDGKPINRDQDMLKWLKSFCTAVGCQEWFIAQDEKHDTIADFIDQLNMDKPFEGVWLNACLAGKPYTNAQGFLNYDLYLPWFNAKAVPLEHVDAKPSKLITFNQELHIKAGKKKAIASVDEFGVGGRTKVKGSDFDL